jgi:hypothetical protein
MCQLHIQGRKSAEQETNVQHWQNWSNMFIRNVGLRTDYTALHPRGWQHTQAQFVLPYKLIAVQNNSPYIGKQSNRFQISLFTT